jgi:hypothetical protein
VRVRFDGWIAGLGTASGTRLVWGHWPGSPFGPLSDVMVEHADGHVGHGRQASPVRPRKAIHVFSLTDHFPLDRPASLLMIQISRCTLNELSGKSQEADSRCRLPVS